jgi:hypothetical protein
MGRGEHQWYGSRIVSVRQHLYTEVAMNWLILLFLVLAVLCFVGFLGVRAAARSGRQAAPPTPPMTVAPPALPQSPPAPRLPYVRRAMLLTRAEQDFFIVLQQAIPTGWHLFPQVRLANLVDVAPYTRRSYTHFNRIAAKCVDFVLCDGTTLTPRLVIELDDASHQRPDRQQRDAFVDAVLQAARLPMLHVRWQPTYDRDQLAAQIHTAVGVPLPIAVRTWACQACGAEVRREAQYCTSCGAVLTMTV